MTLFLTHQKNQLKAIDLTLLTELDKLPRDAKHVDDETVLDWYAEQHNLDKEEKEELFYSIRKTRMTRLYPCWVC